MVVLLACNAVDDGGDASVSFSADDDTDVLLIIDDGSAASAAADDLRSGGLLQFSWLLFL